MGRSQLIIALVIVVVLAVAGYALLGGKKATDTATTPSPTTQSMQTTTPAAPAATDSGMAATGSSQPSGATKEFTVTGSGFKFDPATLTVNKGDKVKITFVNSAGTHDWVLDGYTNVKTKVIQGGQQETIEFTADKAGTFEYYCSVGNHRQMGMKGTLVVK